MKADIEDIYELSPLQQGILFHSLYAPESAVYFVQLCYALHGNLNVVAFEQAWQEVVARHAALRTAYYWENLEKPLQVVHRQVKVPLVQDDWRDIELVEQPQKLQIFLSSDRTSGFDFTQPCLMRLHLIRCTDDSCYFIWSKHHLILDGWSTALVLKEVAEIYQALLKSENLASVLGTPFGDYIGWLQQQDLSTAKAFWQQSLKGVTAPTPLINLNVESSNQLEKYDEQLIKLSQTTTAALQALARQNQLTLNTFVQGAWSLLLSRYSGETDVVYGVTVSGRTADLVKAESIVGMLINTLPVRVKIDNQESLLSWLKQLQSQLAEIRQYEYSPLVEVQGWSEVPRGLPLFESVLVFENYPIDTILKDGMKSLETQCISVIEKTNYPLTVICIPGSELELKISYDRTRFDSTTITRLLGHLLTLLQNMIADVHQRLVSLPILTASEEYQLLVEWNQTQAEYPQDQCFHQLFEAQVEKTPDAVAVVFENLQLTYQELNTRANQLAHYLQGLGVGTGVIVGICVERSLEMLIGLLGILKAGATYLPLDPAYPQERRAFILTDAQVSILLTQQHLVADLPAQETQILCLDKEWVKISQHCQNNLVCNTTNENQAYIIYTSGSTGKPKGVKIPHQALVNFLTSMLDTPGLTGQDTILSVTTITFDIAALELFLPLIIGARLVIVSREVATDGSELLKCLLNGATVMQATPATWRLLLEFGWQGSPDLKILCGGESLPRQLAQQLVERCAALWNMYGPTETTIWSTLYQIDCQKQQVLIGRPIANTQIYVLNQNLQPVPIGVIGELYIGGDGLAWGYLHRPELTAEKFIPHPFSKEPGERLYRTGDLVRYLPDGNLEFFGRIDHQVKLRGFRVELGEIEIAIAKHPCIRQVVVLAKEDALVAYVVTHSEHSTTISELRNFLKTQLPNYMLPNSIVMLAELPLLANGKINRHALPAPNPSNQQLAETLVPPRTAVEEILVGIWAKTLRLELGIHDNFFELGGHSLLATQVVSRIREALQIELPLRCLFESPSVAELSQTIIAKETKPGLTEKKAQILKKLQKMSAEEAKQALQSRKVVKEVRA